MKKIRNVVAIVLAMLLMLCSSIPAMATEDEVRAVADGVLYFSENIDGRDYARGSCFLINEDTIITSNHCVHFTKEEYDALYYIYGYTQAEVDKNLTYSVTIQSDFTIPATLVNSSENMDFAILKLSQPISNHTFLKLRDSKDVKAAETVYSVGFPAVKDTTRYYNQKDIVFESGTINRSQYTAEESWWAESPFFVYEDGSPVYVPYNFKGECFLLSGQTFSGGNSGGPLVDNNGNVIGICMAGLDDINCYASAIDQVMEVLDTVGIAYTKAGDTTSSKTDTETTAATDETTTAEATTAEATTKGGNGLSTPLVISIAAVAAVIVILVVIILIVNSKKKGGSDGPSPSGGFTPPAPPAAPPQNTATGAGSAGSEGTTVLSQNMGDPNATTVLGASANSAYLIRTSNNERINITKPYFKLGKDANRVDYCITGNPAVSRFHASILSKNGQYFIVDNSTTNHTYVNDSMIPANVETQISNGARIKLADEKFEFKI